MIAYCRVTESSPAAQDEPAEASFRTRLRSRLKEQPYPLFCFAEGTIPAASVWTGSRLWVTAFREAGLTAGDRLVLAMQPSAAWLQVMVAAVWEGLTLVLTPASNSRQELDAVMRLVDARAGVVDGESMPPGDEMFLFHADWCAGPLSAPACLRAVQHPPTPDVRFLLRTSGTTGTGRWIGLSEDNLLAVVDSHLPHLGLEEADSRVLSVLPWYHSAGLVIDLLTALFAGCEIHRSPDGGRDPKALLADGAASGITHLSGVPLTVRRLMRTEGGPHFLQTLLGGVIGGAPLDAGVCEFLRSTRLRVGYGQTEASPGICLGKPGYFPVPYYVGEPVGCEVRIDDSASTLQFRGPNACLGYWIPGAGLRLLDSGRWQDTGDIVRKDAGAAEGAIAYVARIDDSFKLANGRFVAAGVYEARIRAQCPDATDNLLLFSRNGENLELATDAKLPSAAILASLGAMETALSAVHTVAPDLFVRTPKGTLNRRATSERVCQQV